MGKIISQMIVVPANERPNPNVKNEAVALFNPDGSAFTGGGGFPQHGDGTFTTTEDQGSQAWGFAGSTGENGEIVASGMGAEARGYAQPERTANPTVTSSAKISASGDGSHAWGWASGYPGWKWEYAEGSYPHDPGLTATGGRIEAQAPGSTAWGHASGGSYDNPGTYDARILATERGATAFGYVSYNGRIEASGYASVAFGTAGSDGFVLAPGSGSLAFGTGGSGTGVTASGTTSLAFGNGTVISGGQSSLAGGFAGSGTIDTTGGAGALAFGFASSPGATLSATASGSIALGVSQNTILSSDLGSLAGGFASNTIQATGRGAIAWGYGVGTMTASASGAVVLGGAGFSTSVTASDRGAFVMGYTAGSWNMTASAKGAMVLGYVEFADGEDAVASAKGAIQVGAGTNNVAKSFKVGRGCRLLPDSTAGTANGDIWLAGGYIYMRSNNITGKVTLS